MAAFDALYTVLEEGWHSITLFAYRVTWLNPPGDTRPVLRQGLVHFRYDQ